MPIGLRLAYRRMATYTNINEKQDTMTDLPQSLPQAWRPPMGWNSWDSYGTTLTEDELLANARSWLNT